MMLPFFSFLASSLLVVLIAIFPVGVHGQVYLLHKQPDHFRSVAYQNTGHEYLPEMHSEMRT